MVELLVNECVKEGGLTRKDFELMLKKDDGKGDSALSIASEEGHPAVEEVLIKACETYGMSEKEINDLWMTGAKNGKQQRRSRVNRDTHSFIHSDAMELRVLLQMLDSGFVDVEGALSTLRLLFTDHTDQLCKSAELADVLQALVAKFISFFAAPSPRVRADAIYCIRMLILPMPNALVVNLSTFLQGILALAKDPSSEVRKEICIALCLLAACKADFMADPTICSFVIEFLLWTTEHDEDYDVKKEACEFWQTVCDNDDIPPGVLKPYLSRLTLVLLNGMVYSEDELNALQEEEEKCALQDTNPALLRGKTKGTVEEEDDEEDDEDGDSQQWTLRKCSALGLDVISNHYKDEILDALLPHIHEKLSHSDWKVQESAVLAMGALAEGCEEALKSLNYLHSFINHLITAILPCQHPLLRSITCWTLSRYANFIAAAPDGPGALLPQMVMG